MIFKDSKPIYRQIIDYGFARILNRQWLPKQKIPSVRELSVELGVNTHTVLKAFEYLQNHNIIYPRRGMGFYLSADAPALVDETRRQEFFEETLADVYSEMKMLGISPEEVLETLRSMADSGPT